jgi:succinoglycan biosynthesis protein ExoA
MGFWPFYADKLVERRLVALRNFAPLALILSLFLSLGISIYTADGWFLLGGILSAYLLGTVTSSASLVMRERKVRYLAVTPFIFGVTHALYAAGSIYGILKPVPAPRIET